MRTVHFIQSILIALFLAIFLSPYYVNAADSIDSDNDTISDYHERTKYHTDPFNNDTDGDGFLDGDEIWAGYSPLHPGGRLMTEVDSDNDGLSDDLEIRLKTSLVDSDTDGDGFSDKVEVDNKYDPTTSEPRLMVPSIKVSTEKQRVYYLLDDIVIGEFIASTGRNDSTPKGEFYIGTKIDRAWSRSAHLWMPFWMPFDRHLYGFHELPEWPGGKKEGQDHLGLAVSGGCVRLGIGDAEFLYNWTPEGTKVIIE